MGRGSVKVVFVSYVTLAAVASMSTLASRMTSTLVTLAVAASVRGEVLELEEACGVLLQVGEEILFLQFVETCSPGFINWNDPVLPTAIPLSDRASQFETCDIGRCPSLPKIFRENITGMLDFQNWWVMPAWGELAKMINLCIVWKSGHTSDFAKQHWLIWRWSMSSLHSFWNLILLLSVIQTLANSSDI